MRGIKGMIKKGNISAALAESRAVRKCLRKLGKVTETVAVYRLKKMRHHQAVEKLATWRMACGFDRLAEDDDSWVHGTCLPTPEEHTASVWSDPKELEDEISMPTRDGPRLRKNSFSQGIEQGTVSFSDEDFARLKRFMEKRDRDAAHGTVSLIDTAQYRSPRSPTPGPSFDACVRVEMEKKDEGTMDPERDQLEPPSASTGFETPQQQCPPNGETGRTTADGCLLVGVGSNLGGNIYAPAEIATPPAASNIIFLQAIRKLVSRRQLARKTSNLSLAGKEKTHRSGKRLYWLAFSEGNACPRCLLFVLRVFYYQVITFQRAEVYLRFKKTASKENKQFVPGGKGEDPPLWKSAVLVSLF